MSACPFCSSEFSSSRGTITEWGLGCPECGIEYALVPTHRSNGGSNMGKTIGMNALGIGLVALTGVGFTYRGGADEPEPIPEHERLAMFKTRVAHRLKALRVIYLYRGNEKAGPYSTAELKKMWDAGQVSADDSYWYGGMSGPAPVTAFVPPPTR